MLMVKRRLVEAGLHTERIDTVLTRLLQCGAQSVLDLGCGSGSLLLRLYHLEQFKRIVGLDVSAQNVAQARERLLLDSAAHWPDHVTLMHGSFTEKHPSLRGFDAAVLLETIEHIEPRELSRLEGALFAYYQPQTVLVTTPNREYNPLLGQPLDIPRRKDHCFEWGREKFGNWARGVARRNGYAVAMSGIGLPDSLLGSPTQMAEFTRCGDA